MKDQKIKRVVAREFIILLGLAIMYAVAWGYIALSNSCYEYEISLIAKENIKPVYHYETTNQVDEYGVPIRRKIIAYEPSSKQSELNKLSSGIIFPLNKLHIINMLAFWLFVVLFPIRYLVYGTIWSVETLKNPIQS